MPILNPGSFPSPSLSFQRSGQVSARQGALTRNSPYVHRPPPRRMALPPGNLRPVPLPAGAPAPSPRAWTRVTAPRRRPARWPTRNGRTTSTACNPIRRIHRRLDRLCAERSPRLRRLRCCCARDGDDALGTLDGPPSRARRDPAARLWSCVDPRDGRAPEPVCSFKRCRRARTGQAACRTAAGRPRPPRA